MITVSNGKLLLSAKSLSLMGDKSYEFSLPLAIIILCPGNAFLAGLFVSIRKIFFIFLMPVIGRLMDKASCIRMIKYILVVQMIAIFFIGIIFFLISKNISVNLLDNPPKTLVLLFVCAMLDSIRQICESAGQISIKNFWIPRLFTGEKKTKINAQVKTLNLSTEVLVPLLTAIIFFSSTERGQFPVGFYLVSFFNILTFIPEYFLLFKLAKRETNLMERACNFIDKSEYKNYNVGQISLINKIKLYTKEKIFLSQVSISCLYITVLSSHSMFLRGYLLDFAKVSENSLAFFQGGAALMGVIGVNGFVYGKKKWGLLKTTHLSIIFQSSLIVMGTLFFHLSSDNSLYIFIFLIASARAGLYGFSIGQTEIEQQYISPEKTGFVMGMATSMNQMASLIILGIGTIFSNYHHFYIPTTFSCMAIVMSLVLYTIWRAKIEKPKNNLISDEILLSNN